MSILRQALLALSTHSAVRTMVLRSALSRRMSRRFVAGETLAEAIDVVQKLNEQLSEPTLD